MEINSSKTKLMIFNDPKREKKEMIFGKINNHNIHSADMLVDKANKCIFSLLKKARNGEVLILDSYYISLII